MDGITAENIYKSYGEKQVLSGVSFFIPFGSRVRLCGPSGAGKTTLLRIISGLEAPDKGSLYGITKGDVSYLFQEDRLFPWLSAYENIRTVIKDKSRLDKAAEIMNELGIGDRASMSALPSELSGGMSRRVAIARALVYDAPVLVLDEALRGLDSESLARTSAVIEKYAKGRTVIFVTHGEPFISGEYSEISVI